MRSTLPEQLAAARRLPGRCWLLQGQYGPPSTLSSTLGIQVLRQAVHMKIEQSYAPVCKGARRRELHVHSCTFCAAFGAKALG